MHDSKILEEVVGAVPPILQCWGRPRKRLKPLNADKAYDHCHRRQAFTRHSIQHRIAMRRIDSNRQLERHRRIVELTLVRFRRLAIRYNRSTTNYLAAACLAATVSY